MAGVLWIKHVQATLVKNSKTVYGDLEAFHRVLGVWEPLVAKRARPSDQ